MNYSADSVLVSSMGFIDTHCHLNDEHYENVAEVVEECKKQGLEAMICIGYDLESSIKAVEIANTFDNVYAAVGIHPDDAASYNDEVEAKLMELAKEPKVVAIGEIGLDYYWDKAPHEVQQEVFARQIELARKLDLPISIHNRDAYEDTWAVLEKYAPVKGVMHCYSGSWDMAQRYLKQGLYISLAGPVTFKNAVHPKEVAKNVPMDKFLVETDSPYLTPHPYRGKMNYPYMTNLVGAMVAELKELPVEDVMEAEKANVKKLFGF